MDALASLVPIARTLLPQMHPLAFPRLSQMSPSNPLALALLPRAPPSNPLLAPANPRAVAYQTLIVYIQTHGLKKNKWKTALFEMLTVISFVKPGVDAHRVASGAEQLPGAAVGPLAEMIMIKCGELMFEAIPG